MHPYLFNIFGFEVPSYGVMIAIAYITSFYYLNRKSNIIGIDKKTLENIVFYTILGGFIGSKLFYFATYFKYFGSTFYERIISIFSVDNIRSGFVFYGGFIGGTIALFLITKKKRLSFLKVSDLLAPALALAHSIGRIGCFLAGCCHGKKTDFFLGVVFTSPYCEVDPKLLGVKIHPTQLYESFGNFLIFLFLNKKLGKTKEGNVTAMYLVMYSSLRFVVEFFRGDDRGGLIFSLSQAQFLSLVIIAVVVFLKLWKR